MYGCYVEVVCLILLLSPYHLNLVPVPFSVFMSLHTLSFFILSVGAAIVAETLASSNVFAGLLYNPLCFLLYENTRKPPNEWEEVGFSVLICKSTFLLPFSLPFSLSSFLLCSLTPFLTFSLPPYLHSLLPFFPSLPSLPPSLPPLFSLSHPLSIPPFFPSFPPSLPPFCPSCPSLLTHSLSVILTHSLTSTLPPSFSLYLPPLFFPSSHCFPF